MAWAILWATALWVAGTGLAAAPPAPAQGKVTEGVSASVVGIHPWRGGVDLRVLAVNGKDETAVLMDRLRPAILTDGQSRWQAEGEWELPARGYAYRVLRFAGARAGQAALTLELNGQQPDFRHPRVRVESFGTQLGTQARYPAWAGPVRATAQLPWGVSAEVSQVVLNELYADITFRVLNGSNTDISLNRGGGSPYLEDDLGNRYLFVPPRENRDLEVPEHGLLRGVLRFAGPVHPEARTLILRLNSEQGSEERSLWPRLSLGPIRLRELDPHAPGTASGSAAPRSQALNLSASHPAGLYVRITRIQVDDDGIDLDMTFTNSQNLSRTVYSEYDQPFLEDNLGNRYVMVPPKDTVVAIEVPERKSLSGTFHFVGHLPEEAQTLTLRINNEGGSEVERTRVPRITVPDIPVPQAAAPGNRGGSTGETDAAGRAATP